MLLNYLKYKFSKTAESPEKRLPPKYAVGAHIDVSRTAYIVTGENALSVTPPDAGLVNAQGAIRINNTIVDRVYFGINGLVEIDQTNIRVYTLIDVIQPTTPEEWNDWLNAHIGAKEIYAPNGLVYQRVWNPGPEQVEGVVFHENLKTSIGNKEQMHMAMLYARTYLDVLNQEAAEYLLIDFEDTEDDPKIKIYLGIDVDSFAV